MPDEDKSYFAQMISNIGSGLRTGAYEVATQAIEGTGDAYDKVLRQDSAVKFAPQVDDMTVQSAIPDAAPAALAAPEPEVPTIAPPEWERG
jgi:hypothetical protein